MIQIIKTSYTEGPWSISEPSKSIFSNMPEQWRCAVHVGEGAQRGNALAIVYLGGDGAINSTKEAVEANAKLIAAAPTLLDACRALLKHTVDHFQKYHDKDYDCEYPTDAILNAIRAINKAEEGHIWDK